MLKTISVALLAISVLAAPAMAAGASRTAHAPAVKTAHVKQNVLNANGKMGRHHHRHHRHYSRHDKMKMGAFKTHRFSKVTIKHG